MKKLNYKANTDYYEIKDSNNKIVFKCFLYPELFENMPQIHIETDLEVYDGPIGWWLNNDLVEKRN